MAQQELTPAEQFAYQFGYTNKSNGSNFGPAPKHDGNYGNSLFKLTTYKIVEGKPKPVELTGVLSEMPEMSFTVEYTKGPGASTQDTLANFFENDIFAIVNAVGNDTQKGANAQFKNLISTGVLSKEMYNGISTNDIVLKFRIYSQNDLGQTPVITWRKLLTEYAIPSSDNEYDIKNSVQNIISALINAQNIGSSLISAFTAKSAAELNKEKKKAQSQEEEDFQTAVDQYMKVKPVSDRAEEILKKCEVSANKQISDNNEQVSLESGEWRKLEKVEFKSDQVNKFAGYYIIRYELIYDWNYHEKGILGWNDGHSSDDLQKWLNLYAVTSDGTKYPTSDIVIKSDGSIDAKYLRKITDSWKNEIANKKRYFTESQIGYAKEMLTNVVDQIFKIPDALAEEARAKAASSKGNSKEVNKVIREMDKVLYKTSQVSDKIESIGSTRFGPQRVSSNLNANNNLGEKLWELTIYDKFLFKKPLIVCIKNWEMKDSKEYVNNAPVYTDIQITCGLDQTYSYETWDSLIKDSMYSTKNN